jgi:hypothetical protein
MDAGRTLVGWNIRRIQDQVSHLAEEDVRRSPSQVSRVVVISVDEAKTLEVGGRFEHRWIIWISDDLRKV